ncbi:MAG: preprotein translocase subunit SecY, partial [Candidatus Xenobia bacterium]
MGSLQVKDLRERLLQVAFFFLIFVLAVHIPVPGIDANAWQAMLAKTGDLGAFLGMFTGGALNRFSIAAMGITPYINASIIMQLLTVVIPQLHDKQKEGGEQGRREIAQWTRYLTVALCVLQAVMMTGFIARMSAGGEHIFKYYNQPLYYLMVIVALCAGSSFMMWVGEQITDKGIGNGVSLLIFAGIVVRYPIYLRDNLAKLWGTPSYGFALLIFFAIFILLIVAIIWITEGERRVSVHYAKRQVGKRVYGGQQTYIPIKVNNAGVISIIFAISIMYLPSTIANWLTGPIGSWQYHMQQFLKYWFTSDNVLYNVFYAALVIFFTYFYSAITFNIVDVADNMKKYGGFVPGIRPGKPTADYLEKILSRVTFVSAIFLAVLAVLPTYVMKATGVTFYLGATSILIIVGVALDTMKQIQARL